MRRLICLLLLLGICLPSALVSCGDRSRVHDGFAALNTWIELDFTPASDAPATGEEMRLHCRALVAEYEQRFSRTALDAELHQLNAGMTDLLSAPTEELLLRALSYAGMTDGAFDPTTGALSALWNITGNEEFVPPAAGAVETARATVGYTRVSCAEHRLIRTDPATQLDLGGVAKGYIAEALVAYLEPLCTGGVLNLGGNIAVFGERTGGGEYRIALRSPFAAGEQLGVFRIPAGYVSVSGSYERYREYNGVRYHHIFDPATGYPAESDLISVAVWSQDGAFADALSTALFVMGGEGARAFCEQNEPYEGQPIGVVLTYSDGRSELHGAAATRFDLTVQ